jgi:uncharacterized protein
MLLKTHFLSEVYDLYDGSQLKPLSLYLQYGLLGSACVSWVGPCHVSMEHMLDGEDKRAQAQIASASMLHFVAELFDTPLVAGVCFQRLMATWVQNAVEEANPEVRLRRDGDDLYWGEKKFSISIAAPAVRSCLIHFAVNCTNQGTPVETCSLEDFSIDPVNLAYHVLAQAQSEWTHILQATYKVHTLK